MKNLKVNFFITILNLLISSTIFCQAFPDKTWQYNTKTRSENWSLDDLKAYRKYITDSTKITGLVIIHKGEMIFKYGDLTENSYIASCRKSVLSMLYGKYVEDGIIDLNKTVKQLGIDDVDGLLPEEKRATVQEIISARSGVYHKEGYPGGMQQ